MRIKTWVIFAALVLSGSLLRADDWSKTYSVTGSPELRVESGDGSIDVSGWDRNEIDVRVTTEGYRIGERGVRIDEHQAGNTVQILVHVPSLNFRFGVHRVRLDIRVPQRLRADLHTGDGHIEATGLQGDLTFRSGDGHITAADVDGSLHIKTSDGRVRASGRFDELDVRTGDGSVEAQARSGSKPSVGWTLTSGDGHINLALPEDFSAEVDLHTGDGHITCDLPVATSGEIRRNELHGKLNNVGPLLRIRTGDGSIHLMKM